MKKLFSTNYTETAFNFSMLLVRVGFGLLLFLNHGIGKLQRFNQWKSGFNDPFGIGSTPSLILVITAEVFCALLVVAGLLSRFASLFLVVLFVVIIFIIHEEEPVSKKQTPVLFLLAFLVILFCGPGKWSLDKLIGK